MLKETFYDARKNLKERIGIGRNFVDIFLCQFVISQNICEGRLESKKFCDIAKWCQKERFTFSVILYLTFLL